MKILVTGGAGFIGSHFVCYSLLKDCTVINVDALTYAGSLENLGHDAQHPGHHFCHLDICEEKALSALFDQYRPDQVVHLAAESHVDRSIDGSDAFIKTNVQGTHSVLEAALKYYRAQASSSFRLLHVSTDEVYGSVINGNPFQESMPYRPNSPYAASKAASDLLVRAYHQTYGLPTLIVNSSNTYGPRQYPEKLIPLTILNALEKKPLPLYGDGLNIRDWMYVGDHVKALWAVLEKGRVGQSYGIGARNTFTNKELLMNLCRVLDRIHPGEAPYESLITSVPDRPGHDRHYETDTTKIQQDTGWTPEKVFEDGLRETVMWYIKHKDRLMEDHSARQRRGLAA